MTNVTLEIERLGQRGEGIAKLSGRAVFVPFALEGERVLAEVEGERGRLLEILSASPDRIAPICKYYGVCGGCAVQTLAPSAYAAWKRGLVATALDQRRNLHRGRAAPRRAWRWTPPRRFSRARRRRRLHGGARA